MSELSHRFDEESWQQLPDFFEKLPEPVRLRIWADESGSRLEREAAVLGRLLAERFDQLHYDIQPRRPNYDYYPVIGVMGEGETEPLDFGLRLIGLPLGYQMTSLVAAIQAVSLRGMTLAARTRVRLHKLKTAVKLELITTTADEAGAALAHQIFNMAVVSPHIRAYLIMGDLFNEALLRYSVRYVPHLIINGRRHISGPVDEETLLKQIAAAVKNRRDS